MKIFCILSAALTYAFATVPLKCRLPLDKHEEVEVALKGCSRAGNEGLVFELLDLPLGMSVEFRGGVNSASLPVRIDMELMTEAGYSAGISKRIVDSVKQAIGASDEEASKDVQRFTDVDKIVFKATESKMYVRVTAEFDGELRKDMEGPPCEPLKATFVFERLYWGFIPTTTLILVGTSVTILLIFWLLGLPLLTWALGPQLIDETRKAQKAAKKND